jgi:hypothetical protein
LIEEAKRNNDFLKIKEMNRTLQNRYTKDQLTIKEINEKLDNSKKDSDRIKEQSTSLLKGLKHHITKLEKENESLKNKNDILIKTGNGGNDDQSIDDKLAISSLKELIRELFESNAKKDDEIKLLKSQLKQNSENEIKEEKKEEVVENKESKKKQLPPPPPPKSKDTQMKLQNINTQNVDEKLLLKSNTLKEVDLFLNENSVSNIDDNYIRVDHTEDEKDQIIIPKRSRKQTMIDKIKSVVENSIKLKDDLLNH